MADRGRLQAIESEPSIATRVRNALRAGIIDGTLAPGTLYSVQALADEFGVSRTPVREALIDLAGQGMVRFERNRGVRVLQTSIHGLEEILTLRLLLEVPSTFHAASQVNTAALESLRLELVEMEAAARRDDEAEMMRHDRRFHETIHEMSGNRRLAAYVDSLRDLILIRGLSTVGRSRSLAEIVEEHRLVIEAIEANDPGAAASAMKRHLNNTALLLLQQEGGRDPGTPLPWADSVPW